MFRKSLHSLLFCILLTTVVHSAMLESLPQAVQIAREQISSAALDSASCRVLCEDLLRLADTYSTSSLVPDALWLAARLERLANRNAESLALLKRLITGYPESEAASDAFDVAWQQFAEKGHWSDGADLACQIALARTPSDVNSRYWFAAFEGYRQANRWTDAADVAANYLQNCPSCTLRADVMLAMADVALQAGDMANARTILESFLVRYPQLPQSVTGRVRLADVYRASGDERAANENYSLAWSAFQKRGNESAYRQPEVANAAAYALWTLQREPLRNFQQLTLISGSFREKATREQLAALEASLQEIIRADESFAPVCFNAIGDLYRQMGDAMLAAGYRNLKTEPDGDAPYTGAQAEYASAIAAYSQSAVQAASGQVHAGAACFDHPDWYAASVYASEQLLDVAMGQSNAVFAWALELNQRAPQADPGILGSRTRFDYIVNNVLPVIEQGVLSMSQALELASSTNARSNAIGAASLDLPIQPVAGELVRIHDEQMRQVAAASTQFAKSLSFGMQSTSVINQSEELGRIFEEAGEVAAQTQTALTGLCALIAPWESSGISMSFWDSLTVSTYYEYASLCRLMESDLTVVLAAFKSDFDDDRGQRFRNRLQKLQLSCATEEYASLVRWHELASKNAIQSPLADRMAIRLAELDPAYAGSRPDEFPSANRRKP